MSSAPIRYANPSMPVLSARHQPALLLTYARSRALCDSVSLRGSRLPAETFGGAAPEISGGQIASTAISSNQYLQMLRNVAEGLASADTSFMLGEQMLPGHYGAASHALLNASNLGEALTTLCDYAALLMPLFRPRLHRTGASLVIYFSDSYGAGSLRGFLAEMHMAAVVAMARWLSGRRLPWQFCFNRTKPRYIAQHEVHLGPDLRFDCQLDALVIDAQWLTLAWPRGNATAAEIARQDASKQALQPPSLTDALYDYLLEHVRLAPTLEGAAQAFAISPATLKRHLSLFGTHFQAELDQLRAHVALNLFHNCGYANEQVARYLGFHDANNFRRSFKRWTGLTPRSLRASLGLEPGA